MSGFSAEWLALRESHDLRARSPIVLEAVASLFKLRDAISAVDLACGAGSTVRALSSHLPARQRWDLVDNDPRLLTLACGGKSTGDVRLNAVPVDLSGNFEVVLDGTKDVITISALLDLVSETWLDRFAREIAARALPVYAALTYDGRIDLSPADPIGPGSIPFSRIRLATATVAACLPFGSGAPLRAVGRADAPSDHS